MLMVLSSAAAADSVDVYTAKGGRALAQEKLDYAAENYMHVLRLRPKNYNAIKSHGVIYSLTAKKDVNLLQGESLDPQWSSHPTE